MADLALGRGVTAYTWRWTALHSPSPADVDDIAAPVLAWLYEQVMRAPIRGRLDWCVVNLGIGNGTTPLAEFCRAYSKWEYRKRGADEIRAWLEQEAPGKPAGGLAFSALVYSPVRARLDQGQGPAVWQPPRDLVEQLRRAAQGEAR